MEDESRSMFPSHYSGSRARALRPRLQGSPTAGGLKGHRSTDPRLDGETSWEGLVDESIQPRIHITTRSVARWLLWSRWATTFHLVRHARRMLWLATGAGSALAPRWVPSWVFESGLMSLDLCSAATPNYANGLPCKIRQQMGSVGGVLACSWSSRNTSSEDK